ncbi:hypothetical protein [Corynebacterium auriscanis]|uniref:hypothetical protein n=1 Tax=Corynebacterium auriscanis TaxID=99807 RepID=UPI0024ADD6EF|nr:hypothetical protein [Corynebacterium auriscanis]
MTASAPAPLTERTTTALAEFTDNIRAMATGSYLRPEDREFWEAPYPESVADQADSIVRDALAAAVGVAARQPADLARLAADSQVDAALLNAEDSELGGSSSADGTTASSTEVDKGQAHATVLAAAIAGVITPKLVQLKELSDKVEGALLDEEEVRDLKEVFASAANDLSASASILSGHVDNVLET